MIYKNHLFIDFSDARGHYSVFYLDLSYFFSLLIEIITKHFSNDLTRSFSDKSMFIKKETKIRPRY